MGAGKWTFRVIFTPVIKLSQGACLRSEVVVFIQPNRLIRKCHGRVDQG